jgi:hypothetical protein
MKIRGRTRLLFVLGAVVFFLSCVALTASADHTLTHSRLYGCEGVKKPTGDLLKSTDPAPGSTVQPGQVIQVNLTWDAEKYDEEEDLHKVLDCVTVNGKLDEVLSGGEKPTANDGVFQHDYTVPADAAPGTEVCDQGRLSGGEEDDYERAISEVVCFKVAPPPPPPPAPEVLPIREVTEAPPQVLPAVEERAPQALPRTGTDGLLGLAMACFGLCLALRLWGRRR